MAYNKSPLTMTDLAVILDDGHRDGPICGVTSRNDSGSEYFRLCRCYRPNNAPDKLLPGQAGFTVPLAMRDELLAALASHRQTLKPPKAKAKQHVPDANGLDYHD